MSSSYNSNKLFNVSSLASKGYPQEAKLLLDTLFGEFTNCYVEIRLLSKGRSPIQLFYPSLATIRWGLVKGKNSEGYNCYFGVCLRKAQKGDKSSVASISALWTDIDAKNFSGGKPEALAQLQKLPPYLFPSVIVDTGHGYHPYWLLREAELIESPQDILRLEAYMKGLALTLHGDSTSDLARVLRLPGLANQKAKNPCLCHIVHWEPEKRFTPMDFDDYQEEIRKQAPQRKPQPEEAKRWLQHSDEFNDLAIEKLLEKCAFIQYCRDNAITLSEPFWWSMVHILAVFDKLGRKKIHELSRPYPKYTTEETNQKTDQAKKTAEKDIGPHSCAFIEQTLGFACPEDCLAKKLDVRSPAGLAAKMASQVLQYGKPEELGVEEAIPPTLELPEDVWQGLFKDYRDLVAGTTEAPNNYHYVCFAQTLGATLARRTYVYHARRLFPNFYICLVGRTAISRKDTARYRAQRLLGDLHSEENQEDPQFQILPGIGSAEGLLDALGGERKVVVLSESELLSLLAKARQEALGNLIPKLTSLFDCPDLETLKTRQRTVVCKEPFLSISSATTLAWLQKAITEKDIYGGFANRFIFVYGNPKPPLPFPPKVDADAYSGLLAKINNIRLWADALRQSEASGELTVPDSTRAMFADYYTEYHKRCATESLPATLIPRVQTFVWKFALLYAAMAASEQILPEHLEPAILAGDYFEQSVLHIFRTFGDSRGKKVENKLLAFLQSKSKGTPIPQRDVYRALNLSAAELARAAEMLERLGLIRNSSKVTKKGRKVLCYEAL